MWKPTQPSVLVVLARAWRMQCPACGEGPVFQDRFRGNTVCRHCGWHLERCVGHWVGGSELNMLVAFPAGVMFFFLAAAVFGFNATSAILGALCTAAFSLWFYRRSRCLFFALDFLLDPPDENDEGWGDWGGGPPRKGPLSDGPGGRGIPIDSGSGPYGSQASDPGWVTLAEHRESMPSKVGSER